MAVYPGPHGPPHWGPPPPHYHPAHPAGPPHPSAYPARPPPPGYGGYPSHGGYQPPPAGYPAHYDGRPPPSHPHAGSAPVGYPPPAPAGSPPPGHYPPPSRPGNGDARSYADEKPGAYEAFERMAVRSTDAGFKIALPDKMCLDKHVPDFLQCLQCWLHRRFGDPHVTGRAWRLAVLDLSRNGLSDASLRNVLELLKRVDVRVERLLLAGNLLNALGLEAVTEYIWNCQDPLYELDLADNEVGGPSPEPALGPMPTDSDAVSGLLRCLYNHPSYPYRLASSKGGEKVQPLVLRLTGNRISHPRRLLRNIEQTAGKDRVRFCKGPETYPQEGSKEYLSIYMPQMSSQRPAATAAAAPEPQPLPRIEDKAAEPHAPKEKRHSSRKRRRKSRSRSPPGATAAAGTDAAPAVPTEQPSTQSLGKATDAAAVDEKPPASSGIDEAEQAKLQKEVNDKLACLAGLPSEESTRDMLAEFAVCMVVAKKGPKEMETELEAFLGDQAKPFTDWFVAHVQKWVAGGDAGSRHQ
eukprot:gnl/TRDRNA2_/TRDRNA2_156222_c3_seq1.p1 gnl/TRDRNA2_/TRDRNA2_156222_c3~~gnl/TRDRNA2_/TRDRNA2_156222_c3_seq1.p1  ORF type:complete len:523 (+),score=101.77 gnl/TRDRNA2_/TRDRNA2_156222_c3_seq1:137-1705(+)